jgi:hypothetical protein
MQVSKRLPMVCGSQIRPFSPINPTDRTAGWLLGNPWFPEELPPFTLQLYSRTIIATLSSGASAFKGDYGS